MAFGNTCDKIAIALVSVSLLAAAGCDLPPAPLKTADGKTVEVLNVSPEDRGELEAATAVETAKVNYRYRLEVLAGYYDKVGNSDKLNWVEQEIKNLDAAQTFAWSGLPEIKPPEGESVADADERVLAEYVAAARRDYQAVVEELADYYQRSGQDFKAALIRNVQARFDPVRTYTYFLSAEIPPADLRPSDVSPEADALYQQALKLYRDGKGILHVALTTDYKKERQALEKFQELIQTYPTSNKIALAAYYIAEISKEYFNEDVRAVRWYERAWQWDPNITQPARFQAATVYDFRLRNYAQALECYRAAIQYEQFNASNVRYAHQRIRELTGQ